MKSNLLHVVSESRFSDIIKKIPQYVSLYFNQKRIDFTGKKTSLSFEFSGLIIFTLGIVLYKHFTYIGIIHDSQIYAADLFRVPSMAPQDMLSLSPQYQGTIFSIIFAPFCKIWPVEIVFHVAHILFGASNFLITYFILKVLIQHRFTVNVILALIFNIVQWEVLEQTIHMNEPFFTVRPVSFFVLQLALLFGIGYHKNLNPRFLWGSGFFAGLSFSFHPITALYFFPAYLAFSPKTYRHLFIGVICGFVPFIIMRIYYSSSGVEIVGQNSEAWSHIHTLLLLRTKHYLFPCMWREMSQTKLFSSVLFLLYISSGYRKDLFGKITFICTLFSGVLMALYIIIVDHFEIDNVFLIALQPMRSFSILNLYLFLLLVKWMTDENPDLPPLSLRVMVFCVFISLAYCISISLSLQLFAVASLWRTLHPLTNNKYLQSGILIILLIEVCTEIFPSYYLLGFKFKPVHLLLIFLIATVIVLLRKRMILYLSLAAVTTVTFQLNQVVRQKHSLGMATFKTDALNSLRQSIPPNSSVVFLPGSKSASQLDLSSLRYSHKHLKVFVTKYDRAPVCFSALYSREFIRRKNRTEYYGAFAENTEQLHSFLRSENIQYVISSIDRSLRLVDSANGLKLYAVD